MSENQSLNEVGAKLLNDVDKNPIQEGPQVHRSGYNERGNHSETRFVKNADNSSSIESTQWGSGRTGKSTTETHAKQDVAGENVKVVYEAKNTEFRRLDSPALTDSETTITRRDASGKEVYRHTSIDPAMASKVGEMAAKKISQELPDSPEQRLAA